MKSKEILPECDRDSFQDNINRDHATLFKAFEALEWAESEIDEKDRKISALMAEIERLSPATKTIYLGEDIIDRSQRVEYNADGTVKTPSIYWIEKTNGGNCICAPSINTGWTEVKCCNQCGRSVEGFWKTTTE